MMYQELSKIRIIEFQCAKFYFEGLGTLQWQNTEEDKEGHPVTLRKERPEFPPAPTDVEQNNISGQFQNIF